MKNDNIEIIPVSSWNPDPVRLLYEIGGWLKRGSSLSRSEISSIISGSYVFVVAVDRMANDTIGMGRAISDGVSDAYIQDLVVKPEYRCRGIGTGIVKIIVRHCLDHGIEWIGLVAEPGSAQFYRPIGFSPMEGYIPMRYGEGQDACRK